MKAVLAAIFLAILAFLRIDAAASPAPASASSWPHWRGPLHTGEAPGADPPLEWSEEKNVRWKTPLPGLGHSSPVVVGDLVFLTAAVPAGDPLPEPKYSGRPGAHDNLPVTHRHRFLVLAFRRADGTLAWQAQVAEELPREGGHTTASLASASPVADAEHLFAFFGSHGLYALDHAGKVIWQTDLGDMHTKHGHGEGSSPVLHGDTLVVNWDHEGDSFIVAFDVASGREKWRQSRDEATSWSSPIVVVHDGKPQVVASATNRVRGYDLETGALLWECGGLSDNVVASPVSANGVVYAGSSYDKRAMFALRLDGAKGDMTGSANVLWRRINRTPYVPSPLLYQDTLYFLAHYQGVLTRADAATGRDRGGPFRLGDFSDIYASPVAAAGRLYITDRRAGTLVLRHTRGDEPPETLAHNHLDDRFSATPAIAGNAIFLRGENHLYCLSTTGILPVERAD